MIMSAMFDAVLLISFGGPQGRDDIRPFLANVLRGRRVTPERVEEVAHHYELFDGVSPLTKLTERQADGLRERPSGGRRTPPTRRVHAHQRARAQSTLACATGTRISWTH